ncbi:MAG TPA: hypothetical protein PLQ21_09470, partial [Candidatus Kapabacteria bacterium]|nr:hypothetical protein [Candidatus Kapabacteria bacterium]
MLIIQDPRLLSSVGGMYFLNTCAVLYVEHKTIEQVTKAKVCRNFSAKYEVFIIINKKNVKKFTDCVYGKTIRFSPLN